MHHTTLLPLLVAVLSSVLCTASQSGGADPGAKQARSASAAAAAAAATTTPSPAAPLADWEQALDLGSRAFDLAPGPGAARFELGWRLLQSFWFDLALEEFRAGEELAAASQTPAAAALACFGQAMALRHPLWLQGNDTASWEAVQRGRAALSLPALATNQDIHIVITPDVLAQQNHSHSPAAVAAERLLFVAAQYFSPTAASTIARDEAFVAAADSLSQLQPESLDAVFLLALAQLGLHADSGRPEVLEAARSTISRALASPSAPGWQHAGLLHLGIHALDTDDVVHHHTATALDLARAYPRLVPGAIHANHMPSHIHFRLGLWAAGVDANLRAIAASDAYCRRRFGQAGSPPSGPTSAELLCAVDSLHARAWAHYGLLQMGRFGEAADMLAWLQQYVAVDLAALEAKHVYLSDVSVAAYPDRMLAQQVLATSQWCDDSGDFRISWVACEWTADGALSILLPDLTAAYPTDDTYSPLAEAYRLYATLVAVYNLALQRSYEAAAGAPPSGRRRDHQPDHSHAKFSAGTLHQLAPAEVYSRILSRMAALVADLAAKEAGATEKTLADRVEILRLEAAAMAAVATAEPTPAALEAADALLHNATALAASFSPYALAFAPPLEERAGLHMRTGNFSLAVKLLSMTLSNWPNRTSALLSKGQALLIMGRCREAQQTLAAAVVATRVDVAALPQGHLISPEDDVGRNPIVQLGRAMLENEPHCPGLSLPGDEGDARPTGTTPAPIHLLPGIGMPVGADDVGEPAEHTNSRALLGGLLAVAGFASLFLAWRYTSSRNSSGSAAPASWCPGAPGSGRPSAVAVRYRRLGNDDNGDGDGDGDGDDAGELEFPRHP